MRKHDPRVFERTHRFLLPQGYVVQRLTGRAADAPSVLATTLLFDIWRGDWSPPLLSASGITPQRLAEILPSGAIAGPVLPDAAVETGLTTGTLVVIGALDQVCAAVAAGNIRPGILTESTGSVLALVVTAPEGESWKAPVVAAGVPVYPHALPGHYCLLPWHQTGGLALKWFRDRFALDAPDGSFEALTREAADVPPGCDGLVALPHLEGAQFPESVPGAGAVFFGAGLSHGRAHFVRAILESIAYMLARDTVALSAAGVPVEGIVALGGGAGSELWLQIKADVCGLPVETLASRTGSAARRSRCSPASVPAASAIWPRAVRAMVRPGRRYVPDAADATCLRT